MGLLLLFLANITALCTEAKNAAVRGVFHAVDPRRMKGERRLHRASSAAPFPALFTALFLK